MALATKKEAKPTKIAARCELCSKGLGLTKVGNKVACFQCAAKAAK